jgi:hypothetical protein
MGSLYEDRRFSWETGLSCTDFVRSPGIVDFLAFCKLQKLLILNDLSCGKNVRLPPPPPVKLLLPVAYNGNKTIDAHVSRLRWQQANIGSVS